MKRGTSLTENQRKIQISWQRQFHSALFCEHSEMLWHWIILNRERVNGGEKKDNLITFPLTQHSQHLSLYEIHIYFNIKIRRKHFCITLNVTCKVLWLGQLQWKANDEFKTKEHFPFFDVRITFRKQISHSHHGTESAIPELLNVTQGPMLGHCLSVGLILNSSSWVWGFLLHNKTMHICPFTCIGVYMCKLSTRLFVLIEIVKKL